MRNRKLHERKWYLATKLLTDGLTPTEQWEWETYQGDTTFRQEFELVKEHWHTLGTLPYGQIDTERDWKLVLEKIKRRTDYPRRNAFAPVWRYAAAVTALLLVSLLVWLGIRADDAAMNGAMTTVIEAPAGSKTFITLPDSSRIWLNAGSRIYFNKDFGTDNRDIVLDGEAFFEVMKDNVRFQVHTDVFDISVLGTAFNVKAYQDDDMATTTLVHGSLRVNRVDDAGKEQEVLLKPNEKLVLDKKRRNAGGLLFTLETNIDVSLETAWKDGWLTVRGESLDDLSKKIERLYDVKIHFEDEGLKTYRYTGRIQQFSLEQVLKALALTSPIEFVINEKSVTLRENKSMRSKYKSLQTP